MYKRVLLSYDGSLEGLKALREGALLAKACGAEVFLLSVVPMTVSMLVAEGGNCGVVAAQNEEYGALLKRAVARLRGMGIEPKARLVDGEPTPAIAAVAKEIDADLVVVGHRNEGLLSRWWSGSKQDDLCDHVNCTVLLARNPVSDEKFEAEIKACATA